MTGPPPSPTLFPYTTLFRCRARTVAQSLHLVDVVGDRGQLFLQIGAHTKDRKSTRLNSSHMSISYAVFCSKKKTEANLFLLRLLLWTSNSFGRTRSIKCSAA